MKRENVNYAVVGAFVLLAGFGLLAVLYMVSGRTGPSDRYTVYYTNISGVKFGTLVYYEGFLVGQVEEIEPEQEANRVRFKVTLSVRSGWPIPADSVAHLKASGLLSAVTVDIQGGSSDEKLAPGDTVEGQGQVNLFAALNEAANDFRNLSRDAIKPFIRNLNEQMMGLSGELRSLVTDSLRPMIDTLRGHVDDPALFTALKSALVRIDAVAGALQALLGETNRERAGNILANVESLSRELGETNRRVQDFLGEETREQVRGILARVETLAADLGATNQRLASLLDDENQGQVKALLQNLRAASVDVQAGAAGLRSALDEENLQRVAEILGNFAALSKDLQASNRLLQDLIGEDTRVQVRSVLARVDRLAREVGESNEMLQGFLDAENQARVKDLLADLGGVAGDLKATSDVIQRLLGDKNQRYIESFLKNINAVSDDAKALVARLEGARAQMTRILEGVQGMVTDNEENLRRSVADLRRTLGVLAEQVDTVAYNLEGSSRNMYEFTRQIRENPGLLLRGSPQVDRAEVPR